MRRMIKLETQGAIMPAPQEKSTTNTSADHHAQAAKFCNKAAAEHTFAAKCCATGEHDKAKEHAKNAEDHCTKAQDHCRQAKAA
jgi:hypothetical protein